MAKKKPEELRLFIKSVHFKGFKSIDDLAIDFKEGLNIVIGKNASGKSNFLECLDNIYYSLLGHSIPFKYSQIEFHSNDNDIFILTSEKDISNLNPSKVDLDRRDGVEDSFFVNGKKLFHNSTLNSSTSTYQKNGIKVIGKSAYHILWRLGYTNISPLYIKYNLPSELDCLQTPGTFNISIENGMSVGWSVPNTLLFLSKIFIDTLNSFSNKNKIQKITKTTVSKQLTIPELIKENLKKLTPIQDVRFNENVNLYKTDKQIIIDNLKIDFKVNGNWIPWSQLSDGTKRLFYMISEITNQKGGLVLVEEPELGIHPHQFHLIMNFLKEESENKQIVISTHSPQALDVLRETELDNVLISYYDLKKGSKIKRLTTAQKNKAKKYMNEVGFLSDYWMLSDLES